MTAPRTAGVRGRSGPRSAAWALLLAGSASAQLLPDPASGTEAGSATVYGEETVSDVDPLARSTRWIDPAQAGDLNRDRVVRTAAMTPSEAAAAGLNPAFGSSRGYAYRAPGVRASFHRPAYITWTLDGPTVNGQVSYPGGFREVIPPDTVYELTLPPVPAAELTAFSAGMLVDGRLPLARVVVRPVAPVGATGPTATSDTVDADPALPAAPRRLQPWVKLRTTADGRATLDEDR